MKRVLFILEKEFRQILRDPAVLRIMFIMPVIQLVILPLAADYEVKNVRIAILDHDKSSYTAQLVNKITSTKYFTLDAYPRDMNDALREIEHDRADMILEIPAGFERDLVKEDEAKVFIAVNAINGVRANLGSAYLLNILRSFNDDLRVKWIQMPKMNTEPRIGNTYSTWYNVHLNYQRYMVPGILVILVTMVCSFLAALNIVKEKEIGTIEQINVTPIRKHHFILGKLIPFWLMGQITLTLGFIIARVVYGIVPEGNILVIYAFSSVYMLAILGLGLLVSTFVQTQQQAMLISFFLMMIFILLGGLYTSIESMPQWAQYIAAVNPVSYFIEVMRMVFLKGSSLSDISRHLGIIAIFAVVMNTWAVLSYRKRS
ncbi:MAG TPA: ABC transporter permease [Chitinophagaceae bacterium]|nr:ABC transporter permease [Chitinophagaceae bacterium]